MKVLTRIMAIAIAFTVVAGGARVVVSGRPAAAPVSPAPATESPHPAPAPVVVPAATPAPSKPPVVENPSTSRGKLIELSIDDQELIAWQDGVVIYRFVVSTGRAGYETPSGRFKVHTKYENRWSRTWKVWMPYAMFWHPKWGYAFHELPYKPGAPDRRIGASKLGTADSHGCVRINLGDARKLYEWAPVGTAVWIH